MADLVYTDGMVRAAVIFGIFRFIDWPDAHHGREQVLWCGLGYRIQFEVNLDRVREQGIALGASLLERVSCCVSSGHTLRGCND